MKRQDIEEAGRNELCCRKPQYLAVIIKPTYDCNLACTYCSVDEHVTHSTMSTQTVDKILSRVTDFCGVDKPIFLIWHGGEPLLMNPDFYEYIGQKTSTYRNYTITNSVQTNATLLNDRFLDVFTKYDFDISISLDGPEYLNRHH